MTLRLGMLAPHAGSGVEVVQQECAAARLHPGPLPRYGGQGMFGLRGHAAVLAAGARQSAEAIHHVDERYAHGVTVAVAPVPVDPGDTPESLADRVRLREHRLLRETLARIASGELALPGLVEADRRRGPGAATATARHDHGADAATRVTWP